VILDGDKQAAIERQARRYADIVVLEHGALSVRTDLHEDEVLGTPVQLQLVGGTRLDELRRGVHGESQGAVGVVGAIDPEND